MEKCRILIPASILNLLFSSSLFPEISLGPPPDNFIDLDPAWIRNTQILRIRIHSILANITDIHLYSPRDVYPDGPCQVLYDRVSNNSWIAELFWTQGGSKLRSQAGKGKYIYYSSSSSNKEGIPSFDKNNWERGLVWGGLMIELNVILYLVSKK